MQSTVGSWQWLQGWLCSNFDAKSSRVWCSQGYAGALACRHHVLATSVCMHVCVLCAVCCVLCKRVADRPWLKLQGYFCLYGKFSLLLLLLLFVPQLCCSISTQRTQHTQTGSTNPAYPLAEQVQQSTAEIEEHVAATIWEWRQITNAKYPGSIHREQI